MSTKIVKSRCSNRAAIMGFLAVLMLTACDNKSAAPEPVPIPAPANTEDPDIGPTTLGIWLHGISILNATLGEAQGLAQAIETMLDSPNDANLEGARLAWHRSHDAYTEFELFTALSGSNPGLFGNLEEHDFAVEAWPIQPGYLDYYDVYTHSGIVNDLAMPLTAKALREQHGFTDPSDVSLGFHSLEYLLWGENSKRPASDYTDAALSADQQAAGVRPVDLPNNRRRVLLALIADLLIDDIESLTRAVENPSGLLRRNYVTLQPHSRLALLQNAGQVLLSHHSNLLQAQLENRAAREDGPATVSDDPVELQHSPFAGGAPGNLAHSLHTAERILLGTENGLGNWLVVDQEQRTAKLEQMAQLRTELLGWHDRAWPPENDRGQAIVDALAELAEIFESELSL